MASVYARPDRLYLYAKIRDVRAKGRNKWRGIKTPFRKDSPAALRNALVWANELDRVGKASIRLTRHFGWSWVFAWLGQQFGYNRLTKIRYETAWAHLNEFLVEHGIRSPAELFYRHASEYMAWRTTQVRRRGTTINHNTALTEAKVMSRILQEARRRDLIQANPWAQLGIRRQNVRHAPPMNLDEIARTRAAVAAIEGGRPLRERWMTLSFEIALHQGVRLMETMVPMARVHLDERTDAAQKVNMDRITFEMKGRFGEKRIKTLPVHPVLRPWLLALRAAGAEWTCELPRMAAKAWWAFRQQNGLAHLRFHSTRATVTTQLPKNGVPMQKAMAILGHNNAGVHLAYLHLTAGDVADEIGGLNFSTPGPGGSAGGPAPTR